jgi:acetyl esterase/lipase
LIVWLHDGPWLPVPPGFRREAQALAAMGFAVLEVNHRGTNGFGRRHVTAMQEAYDRVPLEDVLVAVAWGRERAAFDPARVAVAGRGVGGYLALRALQLHPEVFRAGAALNAPMDLGRLYQPERDIEARQRAAEQSLRASAAADRGLPAPASDGSGDGGASGGAGAPVSIPLGPGGGGASPPGFGGGGRGPTFERERARRFFGAAGRQRIGVDDHLDALTQPVFLAHDPALPVPAMAGVARVRDALVRRRQVVEWMELTPAYSRGDLKARAEVVRRLGEFLQNHVGGAATEGGR